MDLMLNDLTDRERSAALARAIIRCESKLGLSNAGSLKDRVVRIVTTAQHRPLRGSDYDLVYFIYSRLNQLG
jgi:hypothetical protein